MLLISILILIISNSVTLRRDVSVLLNRIAIIILLYCINIALANIVYIKQSIGIHGGLLHVSSITLIFQIFLFVVTILVLQLTSFYFFPSESKIIENYRKHYLNIISQNFDLFSVKNFAGSDSFFKKPGENLIEYPLILLFIISGGVILMSSNDLISIFFSIELQSYGLYLLCTISRNSELSTSGGLIYFLLGGLSSSLILLGISLLYVNSGTTNLDNIFVISSLTNLLENNSWYESNYINISLFIFSVGFLFKISAAPFHFWSPDVYDSVPTIITISVAILSKISIFIFLLDLIFYTNSYLDNNNWTYSLLISSVFSFIIGTILGLTQFRIKKLLAYSTISHVGFLLLSLKISSVESTYAFLFYLIQYFLTSLNSFLIIISIGFFLYYFVKTNKYKNLLDKNNSPIQLISQLKGYFFINNLLSLSLIITIFSFTGIPPLMGFFGKLEVLSSAINSNFIFISVVAILSSVIGGVYYLNLVKEMLFKSSDYYIVLQDYPETNYSANRNIKIPSSIAFTVSIITLTTLLFVFMNKEWLYMITILVQSLYNY